MSNIEMCSVYKEELYLPFIRTLVACSTKQSIIFLGMTRDFLNPHFFDLLNNYFTYTLLPYESISYHHDKYNIGIFICQPKL